MRKLIIMGMAALLALSFGMGQASHVMAQGKVVRITLIDENGSGEDGSAQITDQGDGTTKVELIMTNAPDGAVQPAGIHEGSCANLDTDVAYPLEAIQSLKSTSTVKVSLADLTNSKYAVVVTRSASDNTVISCGIMPSAAVVSGVEMTMDQAMETLLDQANELAGTIAKKEADASTNAYNAFHATFAAHEDDIKAKSAPDQAELEDAMHAVRDAINEGNWDEATTAAATLITKVTEAREALADLDEAAGAPSTGSPMMDALNTLESQANDLVRETGNKDTDGTQAAYDAFHTTFATNEDAVKAQNASAQAMVEDAMHEVRDAFQAGNWDKASDASNELVDTVKEVRDVLSGASGGSTLPVTGTGGMPLGTGLGLVVLALGLLSLGVATRRRAAR
ncbi:MAG TPA: hypothetical protein VLQ48_16715 [Chloroflexia bacterium]|nr:hypothetical protein [Chloroflexia bacterium]